MQNIDNRALGNLLQIVFTNGVRNQLSSSYRDFEMVKSMKEGDSLARELRFNLQSTLGAAAIQYRNPGQADRPFPRAQAAQTTEYTAIYKEIDATIEVAYNVYNRAMKTPEKYAAPLVVETESKATASKRRLAADFYLDGTGAIGQLAADAIAVTTPNSNMVTVQLATTDSARGHIGAFEEGDILILRDTDASTTALDTNLSTEPAYWEVVEKNRDTDVVTLKGLDSDFAPVATITSISTPAATGALLYRFGQPTIPDVSGTITDYATLTEVMTGLESLAAADGRVVHGITMRGATAATRVDAGGNPIDVKWIQKALSKGKVRVGEGRYKYKQALMAPETLDALVESRESDRKFVTLDDTTRGGKKFGYQHGEDFVEFVTSEYCPKKRVWIIPEAKNSEHGVLEFWGTDFEAVQEPNGSKFRLKTGSNGYVNTVQCFLEAVIVLIATHPAAIICIHNFTVA